MSYQTILPAKAWLRALAILVSAVLFAYVHSNTTVKSLIDDYRNGQELSLIDVGWLHSAATLTLAGKSPYDRQNIATLPQKTGLPDIFVYPPIMIAPVLPLGLLTLSQATILVGVVNFAALALIFVFLAKYPIAAIRTPVEQVLAAAVLFGFASFVQTYKSGNPLLFSIALMLLAWMLVHEGRSRFLAGIVLGVATLYKPHFGFLFLPFLIRKDYAALAGGMASLVAALVLVHSLLPLSVWSDYFGRVGGAAMGGQAGFSYASMTLAWNQSLPGVLAKLLPMTPPLQIAIYTGCLALLLVTVFAVWRERHREDRDFFGFAFSILLVASFLAMPVSWVSYFCFVVVAALWRWPQVSRPERNAGFAGLYILGVAAMALPYPHILSVYQKWWIYMWPVLLPLALWFVLLLRWQERPMRGS